MRDRLASRQADAQAYCVIATAPAATLIPFTTWRREYLSSCFIVMGTSRVFVGFAAR